jgi:hypothetical protein
MLLLLIFSHMIFGANFLLQFFIAVDVLSDPFLKTPREAADDKRHAASTLKKAGLKGMPKLDLRACP